MAWHQVLCLVALVVVVYGQTLREQDCPREGNSVEIQAGSSAMLGGILSLSDPGANGFGCGEPYGSMQSYEAIRWVLDLLNKKDEYLQTEYLDNYYIPGVTLGMKVINNCMSRSGAVASIGEIYDGLGGDSEECSKDANKMVFGIIGGSTSDQAIDLSLALQPHEIPLISHRATAPLLTTSGLYPNFMRTVPPDTYLMEVIVKVLLKLDWRYVAVVYDSGTYGRTAYSELLAKMIAEGLCLTTGIPVDGSDLSDGNMNSVLNTVLSSDATGVIFFGSSSLANAALMRANARMAETDHLQWIIPDYPIDSGLRIPYMRGVISITTAYRIIVEFEDHWIRIDESNPSAENPWFKSWFAEKNDCSYTPTAGQKDCDNLYPNLVTEKEKEEQKRAKYQQDQFVEPAVMAVFTYAKALRTAQQVKCGGSTSCDALVNMDRSEFFENYLKKVNFTFTSDERVPSLASSGILPYGVAKHLSFTPQGDVVNPSFYIWNYNDFSSGLQAPEKFRNVGTINRNFASFYVENVHMYSNARTARLHTPPKSLCPSMPCSPCMGLPSDVKYYYEPGDVIINGIFSLHNKGRSPLSCGGLKSWNQVMFLEAMIYAIKSVNDDVSILRNIKLGGLGIDDCSSQAVGQAFISQVQRGSLMIKDTNGNAMNPRTIEAYTAAQTNPLTDPIAEMMNYLKRPMVGYIAGSSKLDDTEMYPYFIRANPSVRDEVRAIILLLKNYEWMHVQVMTSDESFAKDAYMVFRDMAAKEGICIVATHNLGSSDEMVMKAVQSLGVNKRAPVTIALLGTMDQRRLLTGLHANLEVRQDITLIASSGWGSKSMLVNGMESTADGVITISVKQSSLQSFQEYLKTLKAEDHKSNPWFLEWFRHAHNCATSSCDYTKTINDGNLFNVMYEAGNVIIGIQAIARALDQTLTFYCGPGYFTICSSFSSSGDKGSKFMEYLRGVSFPIEDMAVPNIFTFIGSSPKISFDVNNYRNTAYNKVGTIDTWSNTVSIVSDIKSYQGHSTVKPTCPPPCLECFYMFNHQDYIHVDGDVMLGAIFNVHYAGSLPFTCGALRPKNGAMYTEVFNFAVNRINQGSTLNNVKLGFLGFDGCSNPTRAMAIINRVNAGLLPRGMTFANIMSWITYDSETTKEAATFLQKMNMPLVSPGATLDELTDKTKYNTLFRTVYSDAIIAKGMASLVVKMGWKNVFILNSPDASNREAARVFRETLNHFGICVLNQFEFVTDGSMDVILTSLVSAKSQIVAVFAEPDQHVEDMLQTKANKPEFNKKLIFISNRPWEPYDKNHLSLLDQSLYFKSQSQGIPEFLTYLESRKPDGVNNPWFSDIYEEYFECNLKGSFLNRPDCATVNTLFSEDIWTLATLDAVYSLAQSLHATLLEKCGPSYSEVCLKFSRDQDTRERLMFHMDNKEFKLDIVTLAFEFIERESSRSSILYQYISSGSSNTGNLPRTGMLALKNEVNLKKSYASIESECGDDCLVCQDDTANIQDFTLMRGDMYIVGLFDVHKAGPTPFTCGEINEKHGALLLEAFHFAIDYVNSQKGIFSGMEFQLGGIGLDMCQSPTRAANLVANIHSGKVKLSKNGMDLIPRQIDAYIGTMDTESSIRVADILNQLLIPQISYGASGMDLLNRDKYNYFLRSVPADDKMGRAIISYLKKFKYNNIQVIKSFDEIGEPGSEEFERLALINLVCITKVHLVGKYGDIKSDAVKVLSDVKANATAQVVVLWMKDPLPVLEVANNMDDIIDNVLFVATDKWGADPDYLKIPTITKVLEAKNLILLDVESADVPGLDMYLSDKTPDNYPLNPWFKEIYEKYQGCNWDLGNCDKHETIPRLDSYVQDPYALYVVNAVFSAALGVKNAVRELCRKSPQFGLCNFYATSGERRQKVLEHLKSVEFTDSTHQPFFFTEDGQSDRGFHFYNVTDGDPKLKMKFDYENVGSYNDSHFLKLDITYNNNYIASCDPKKDCVCEFKEDLPTRFMKKMDGGSGLTLVYVGDIHQKHPSDPYKCGKINAGVDLHRMLAFFYAIELVNSNKDLQLHDTIRFDGVALDSCSSSLRLGQDVYNVLSGNKLCDSDDLGNVIPPSSIAAFITDKDKNAVPISTMLSSHGITSISPTAIHDALDDPYYHPRFLRMQSSSREMNQVILDIADNLDWNLIGVIYTDMSKHRLAKDSLIDIGKSRSRQVCVGSMAKLTMDADMDEATQALSMISQETGVTVVVLFVEPAHFRLLMESSRLLGSTGIVWVVPSNWDTAEADSQKYISELASSVWIQSRTGVVEDFKAYVKKLNMRNKMGIPDDWFKEIYETLHSCRIMKIEESYSYSQICTGEEVITDDMLTQDPSILHVVMSVYVAALGIQNIPQCRGPDLSVAACLQLQNERNRLIYDGILGVNFETPPNLVENKTIQFAFNREGNAEAGFDIISRDDTGRAIHLGQYTTVGLEIDKEAFAQTTSFDQGGTPSSRCAPGATCYCYGPGGSKYGFSPEGVQSLQNVQVGKIYRDPDTGELVLVEKIPGLEDRFDSIWAIIIMVIAGIGAVVGFSLFVYLLVMYPVRGGTSILGYIVSFGIVLLYLMVFPFIAHASEQMCALRRFGLGIVYAIVYSALLVKLVDCWRVRGKGDEYSTKYSKLGRPVGLFFVTFFLVLVQAMINAEWLILEQPETENVFYKNMYWPRCVPDDFYDEGLVLSLAYIMGLILLSFVIGICTFTMSVNHREARWIFGVIILSIPCWVIWCTVSILGAYKVRDAAVAIGLIVNATFMLLLMPVRKLYLLSKYNKMIEEEDKVLANGDGDYMSVYGRQYDNSPQMQPGSVHGSSIGYPSPRS